MIFFTMCLAEKLLKSQSEWHNQMNAYYKTREMYFIWLQDGKRGNMGRAGLLRRLHRQVKMYRHFLNKKDEEGNPEKNTT
ncbi:hypothetical protein Y1Q_0022189 [Alligator mississippiensis]|uniref:Uncharacterized protein n=1 Tax=Alligator mississippiensis TaxID=8496 RepID=A0A151NZU6_ALLMI|nr:hypothetical protein Y1Q_0022189 [Alligator mississippiensis]